ncbi:MAG: phenylalanine--tRNA ligase subunit alpha, partial [Oscillospiraceae bacterium]|nr:phenylalanine--tRNA ligase subunit alpha [Oscillospiraceae bacterium]
MEEQIKAMREKIEQAAAAIQDSKEMYQLRKQYLDNKAGQISALMKNMRDLAPEERPAFGKIVNELKTWALDFFTAQDARLKAAELAKKNAAEQIDVTMPAAPHTAGALHPNTLIANELIDIFAGMGFTVFEGPEIENDYYNFTALNTPKDHPARDMQDTFYVSPELLLRTQTSAGQIRVMEKNQPPIKILSPGKVFRSDD